MEGISDTSGESASTSGEEAEDAYFYRDSKTQRATRRRRRRDDATYGIFGDELINHGVDGHDDAPITTRKGGLGFVSFVREEQLGRGPGTEDGMGGGDRPGLGNHRGDDIMEETDDVRHREDSDDQKEYTPSATGAFGRRVLRAAAERREREWGSQNVSSQHKSSSGASVTAQKSNVGMFEAHTKGIGAKLLSKMGWKEGEGLGKDGKGLSRPLEATLRPKRQGMGFGNRREPSLAPTEDRMRDTGDEDMLGSKTKEAKVDVQLEARAWRKRRADSKLQEKKQIFKTVDDVMASSDGAAKSSIQTIIDMRGPQKRVIHDVGTEGALLERQHHVHDEGPLPELQHNMRLLVDLNEAEIKKIHARVRHSMDTKTLLEKEESRLQREKLSAEDRKNNLARAVSLATKIRDKVRVGMSLSVESRTIFSEAKIILGHGYYRYRFHILAAAVIHKPFLHFARGWSPLSDPTLLLPEINEWKHLLSEDTNSHQFHSDQDVDIDALFASSDPFVMLIVDVVLPKLRSDIQSSWDPKDSDSLSFFLDSWRSVLPNEVISYVMQHLVLPKLRIAVEHWEPLVDHIAPHMWLHPHLPYLGSHMRDLWPIIRLKFTSALSQWHPSDPTALEMLKPWKRVFSSQEWDQLCSRAIEPKLTKVLDHEFFFRSADEEDLEVFSWVMAWDAEIRPDRFARILDNHFFPKWRSELRHMLTHDPNFDEVARWYLSWKSYMSDEILETVIVSRNIEAALDDMSKAVAGEPLAPTWTTAPASAHDSKIYPAMKLKASQRAHRTIKELIAQFAEDSGVDFVPKLGRMHEGLQVYHFGLVLCVVNTAHETISAQMDTKSQSWRNVSLDELLEENDRRLRQHAP